jgi:TonB-linked SusC/RagA family outer membrane protein
MWHISYLFSLKKREYNILLSSTQNKIAMNLNFSELHPELLVTRCLKPLMQMRKKLSALLLTMVLLNSFLFAQQTTVTGKITDEKSNPLTGVAIKVSDSHTGVITDANGNFSINVAKGQTLEISYVGKTSEKVIVGSDRVVNITLKDQTGSDLNEVVVTGYMTQKKADLTGAVAVVSAKDLSKDHGATNILQSLQGVVPGLHISTDGNPAGNVDVQIRGLTSLNGGSPLIVIDGVPSYMNLRDINPDNIASMQVLKDAYSASIYGTQGGAGVILIQTKKGQAGKAKISYDGSVGFAKWNNKPAMLNTMQYGQALWQAAVNDGQDPNAVTQIYDYDWHKDANGIPVLDKVTPIPYLNADSTMPSANTNWLDAISQQGIQQNHQLTISGGTDRSTSLLSLNYMENQGTQIYTGYKRFTVRVNTDYRVINDHFSIGENMEASHLIVNDQNVMHDALVEPPIIPVHTTDGGWGGSAVALGMDDYWNPVRELTLNKDNGNKYNKLYGDVHANVYLKNFTLHSQLGMIYTDGYHRNIQFTFEEGGGKFNPISSVDQWYWRETTLDLTNTIDYKLSRGKHNLDVLAGMEANKYVTETMDASRQDIAFQNYDYAYLSTATGNMSMSGGGDKYNLLSYFGKFNYVFNSKYLLSGSLRYDGSSKFGSDNRFALFPAISGGWRISQEDFLKNNNVISDLKLRASWGRNGSLANINSLASQTFFASNYNYTSYSINGAETGSLPSGFYKVQTGNADLRWEETTQTNIGLDFGFLRQALSGSLDFYRKFTNGMLIQPPYLGTFGEGAYQYINAADMTDNGVELSLTYSSPKGKDFSYQVNANIAYNHNSVNDLPASVQYSWGGSALKGDGIEGHPWGSYYGFIADGIYQNQQQVDAGPDQPGKGVGRIRYKDISGPNGKPDGKIDYDYDRTWIGDNVVVQNAGLATVVPKVEYGFAINLAYKSFDLSMSWQGVAGIKEFDGWKTYSDFWNVWVQNGFNHPTRVLDAWAPTNTSSTIPALSLNNVNDELRMSTYLIEPGQYLKLRNIQLGYNLPKSFSSRLGMDKFYVYIVAENLIMFKSSQFTGPDPENADGQSYANPYVRPQVFKAGIEVSF